MWTRYPWACRYIWVFSGLKFHKTNIIFKSRGRPKTSSNTVLVSTNYLLVFINLCRFRNTLTSTQLISSQNQGQKRHTERHRIPQPRSHTLFPHNFTTILPFLSSTSPSSSAQKKISNKNLLFVILCYSKSSSRLHGSISSCIDDINCRLHRGIKRNRVLRIISCSLRGWDEGNYTEFCEVIFQKLMKVRYLHGEDISCASAVYVSQIDEGNQ